MRRPRLTARGRGFLLAGVLVVATGTLLGFPDLTRIGVLLTVLPLLAWVSLWRRRPDVAVTRRVLPARLERGSGGTVQLELRNTGRRTTPPHLVHEHVPAELGDPARFVLPPTAPGESATLTYAVHGRGRGEYRLGPLTLTLADPFGMAGSTARVAVTTDVLVQPRVERLGPARWSGRTGHGELSVPVAAVRGQEDVATRAYRYGDDLRRIHWPATAHRGELIVRQEERPARRRAALVLDPRRTGHRWTGPGMQSPTFEWSVDALASIAAHLDAAGYVLQLVSLETLRDGRAGAELPLPEILRLLALALPEAGELDVVQRATADVTAGLVVAVVCAQDSPALQRLGRGREPGARGVLLVVGGPDATGVAARARRTGWTSAVAEVPGPVRPVWDAAVRA